MRRREKTLINGSVPLNSGRDTTYVAEIQLLMRTKNSITFKSRSVFIVGNGLRHKQSIEQEFELIDSKSFL